MYCTGRGATGTRSKCLTSVRRRRRSRRLRLVRFSRSGLSLAPGLAQLKPRHVHHLRDSKKGAVGTPLYMAPEVMLGKPFNEKAGKERSS